MAKSRLFTIEQLSLEFSNGEKREYERMKGTGRGAVMIIPVDEDDNLILVEEYAAGTHSYHLGFPKGLIDPGELPEQAANRELKEEVGLGAKNLELLQTLNLAPGFFNAHMHLYLATGFYPEKLPGDEPEPLKVVRWPVADAEALLAHKDFSEARSVCGLLLLQKRRREAIYE